MIRAQRLVDALMEADDVSDDDDFPLRQFVLTSGWRDSLKRLGYKELQFTGTIDSQGGSWGKRFNQFKPASFRILITQRSVGGSQLNAYVEQWVYEDPDRHNRIKFKGVIFCFILNKANFKGAVAEIEEAISGARSADDVFNRIVQLSERDLTEDRA